MVGQRFWIVFFARRCYVFSTFFVVIGSWNATCVGMRVCYVLWTFCFVGGQRFSNVFHCWKFQKTFVKRCERVFKLSIYIYVYSLRLCRRPLFCMFVFIIYGIWDDLPCGSEFSAYSLLVDMLFEWFQWFSAYLDSMGGVKSCVVDTDCYIWLHVDAYGSIWMHMGPVFIDSI